MSNTHPFFSTVLKSAIALTLVVGFGWFALQASAGDMVIEVGTVFSDSSVKDGRRVEVQKTYTYEGVLIEQQIYDEAGNLIRERSRLNPLPSHVRLVGPGEALDRVTPLPSPADHELNQRDDKLDTVRELVPDVEVEPGTQVLRDAETLPLRLERAASAPDLEESDDELVDWQRLGPELALERVRERHRLFRVDQVYVGQREHRAELVLEAVRQKRFLGLFEVELPVRLVVDADDGEVVSESKPWRTRILDWLSFD